MAEIYLELQRNGAYLKCSAVCAETSEEATAIGPLNDPEGVKRLAVLKLQKRLAERAGGTAANRNTGGSSGSRGGGIVI